MSSKEKILANIRQAKGNNNIWKGVEEPLQDDFFQQKDESLLETFRQSFEAIDGKFHLVSSDDELQKTLKLVFSNEDIFCVDNVLQERLKTASIHYQSDIKGKKVNYGFIRCEYITARLGSVITSALSGSGRQLNVFPENQVVFVEKEQLVADTKDALLALQKKYDTLPSMISLATGPSRTADIEKTLILGAHGPKTLTVIFKNY